MNTSDYIKEKIPFIAMNSLLFSLIAIFMKLANVQNVVIFLIFCLWFFPIVIYFFIELIKKKLYFDELAKTMESLEKKYFLTEVIKEPSFVEGRIIYDILRDTNKSMNEEMKEYKSNQLEYREYIETWVHEIKTPIASAKLIIENNQSITTNKINNELKKVEEFIEQVLYYARSSDVSKDYIIKEFSLKMAVMPIVKKNSRDFINKRVSLNIEDLEYDVFSDIKWVEFVLNQLIVNAIKYSKDENAKITIKAVKNSNNIILSIEDNGVGIMERDINRVFDKGFTGENGRVFGKSTGMGLYLCKNLCDKLGLGLNIKSKVGEGTTINLIFPLGNLTNFE